MRVLILSTLIILLVTLCDLCAGLYTTTLSPDPDDNEITTILTTVRVTVTASDADGSESNKTLRRIPAEEDEKDEDLGLETRSFHSSKRKNKITDNHWKVKEKKVKLQDPDSRITMADLTDELGEWEAPEDMSKNYPYYLAGYDNDEQPLWVAEYGRFNIREMIERGPETTANLEKYTRQCAYRIVKSIRERNNEVGDVTAASVILDLDGLSLYQLTHPPTVVYVLKMVRIYADLVDECVGNVVVINANYIAETLINLVRPLFGRAMEKVDIYGTQAAKWRPVLRQLFPLESIPSWYGGIQGFKPIKVYG